MRKIPHKGCTDGTRFIMKNIETAKAGLKQQTKKEN
jgi:hypothetical protein